MRRIWPAVMRHSTRRCSTMPAAPSSRKGNWLEDCQLAGEVRKRYFGIPDATIDGAAVDGAAGDAQTRRNPFWSTPHGAPLIRDLADVSVTFGAGQASSHH